MPQLKDGGRKRKTQNKTTKWTPLENFKDPYIP